MRRVWVAPVVLALVVHQAFPAQLELVGRGEGLWYREKNYTEVPAYSDTLGTWKKCHCKQIVTVTRGS